MTLPLLENNAALIEKLDESAQLAAAEGRTGLAALLFMAASHLHYTHARAVGKWLPTDTMPTDETEVLGCYEARSVIVFACLNEGKPVYWRQGYDGTIRPPLAWQPLPEDKPC